MEPIKYSKQPGMIEVLVTIQPPVQQFPPAMDRGARYRSLMQGAQRAQDQLISWLKRMSVWDEVAEVGEPNVFNIVPLTCSYHVASLLEKAPGVTAVTPADAQVDMIE
jgi:hypothetical protein